MQPPIMPQLQYLTCNWRMKILGHMVDKQFNHRIASIRVCRNTQRMWPYCVRSRPPPHTILVVVGLDWDMSRPFINSESQRWSFHISKYRACILYI